GETALLRGGLVERLPIDLDLHVLTDEHPVRDGHVPGETERGPIDRRGRGGAEDLTALSVRCDTEELDIEAHRSREPTDREIAARGVPAFAFREDRVALERDLRVLLGV